MTKADIIARICADRIIAIAQSSSAAELVELARELAEGGITHIELPLTIPAMPEFLKAALKQLPDSLNLTFGLGTVIDTETARRGILAGARFISTPALRPKVILLCRRHQIPVFCGVHSIPEIQAAIIAGADAVKLYPSQDRFGPTHVSEVRAQFPTLKIFPIGGVTAANIHDFIVAGADAVSVASGLFPLAESDPLQAVPVRDRARALVKGVAAAISPS
jgi:2-dehydro-3-deoxyphosphogluconate aldolase/(4S)-4-hydroxy-2-oxoglutarate aldolase